MVDPVLSYFKPVYLAARVENATYDIQCSSHGLMIGLLWRLLCSFLLGQELKMPFIDQVLTPNQVMLSQDDISL